MKYLCAVLVGLSLTAPALAQDAAKKDPCAADARRFCKDAIPDDNKIAACLKANQSKLGASCKASFAARMKAKGM